MARNADIVIFYYSGHATRINDGYCLVPAKTSFEDVLLPSDLLPIQDILTTINGSRLKLLFFDSCRDDAAIGGLSKGNPNIVTANDVGPATNINSSLPSGTMICYAVDRGKKAYTGSDSLSPFTKALSEHLTDGDEFRTVWKNVITDVYLTQKQRPVNDGFYQHDLYLNPNGKKHIVPQLSQKTNKKSITIIPNATGSIIDFNGTTYDAGKPLEFEIGRTYTYTIKANGYNQYVGILKVTDSTPSIINITMQKDESATLYISSVPKYAGVEFDNKYIGRTPIEFTCTSGTHSLLVSAKGYYDYHSKIDLNAGTNSQHVVLTRKKPWFFDWDEYDAPTHHISYLYSPKYQIGLQFLYRINGTHFLLGANAAISTSLFRGLYNVNRHHLVEKRYVNEYGNEIGYIQSSFCTKEYQEDVDPYHEAKTYDSNFMFLVASGYQPCNGILLETGFGVASHCDKYYMPYNYSRIETITKKMNSNEVIGEPIYEYIRNDGSQWYYGKVKWSPTMRMGLKFLIPIGIDNFLTIGGGYTYLFSNSKFSAWDASIGIAVDL